MVTAQKTKNCRVCDDTGWELITENGIEKVKRCDCFLNKNIDILLKKSRIPKRYVNCTLEKFKTDIPYDKKEGENPKRSQIDLATAQQYAKDFIKKYPDNKKGLFFMGKCGVGKTHLAIGIILELIKKKGAPCLFYDFRDLLKEIQASYDPQSQISELSVLEPVINIEVLVLDELGASKVTAWMRDILTYIINKRYNDKKMIIITSNWMDQVEKQGELQEEQGGRKQIGKSEGKQGEDSLEDRIGVRLRSRLYEMCNSVEIVGVDYRGLNL
ncbi:MAG: ATP-binding protein [bacterium]